MGLKFILNSNILFLSLAHILSEPQKKNVNLRNCQTLPYFMERSYSNVSFHFVRLSVLVTGFDQNAHCRSFLIISPVCSRFFLSVFFHSISNLLYDCNLFLHFLSIPNIVDPKSLTLLNVHQIFSLPWFLIVLMDILINLHLNAGWD